MSKEQFENYASVAANAITCASSIPGDIVAEIQATTDEKIIKATTITSNVINFKLNPTQHIECVKNFKLFSKPGVQMKCFSDCESFSKNNNARKTQ